MYIVNVQNYILLTESQKGVNAVQRCSIENQKDAITVQSLWASALLVLNGTLFDSINAILAFSRQYAAKVDSYNWFYAFVICSWKLYSTGSKYLYSITFTVNFWFIQKFRNWLCWKHSIILKHWMLVEAVGLEQCTVTVNFWFIQKLLCAVCWKQSIRKLKLYILTDIHLKSICTQTDRQTDTHTHTHYNILLTCE